MKLATVVALVATVCVVAGPALAVPFEPVFKIVQISGECFVMPPDSAQYTAAVEGQAYPYGTKVKTGRNSSAVISFSEGNTCRILAKSELVITEDTKDKKLKIIKLDVGKIEAALEKDFEKSNGLNVATPTAICGAIGCRFSVESTSGGPDLMVTIVLCEDGKIKVFDRYGRFMIPTLNPNDGVSVSGSFDGAFVRIKILGGNFIVQTKDSNGNPTEWNLPKDATIRIHAMKSSDGTMMDITIIITYPDGKVETISYAEPLTVLQGTGVTTTTVPPELTTSTTTTTTSTTTTTTVPPKTTPTTVPAATAKHTHKVPSPTPVGHE